MVIRKMLFTLTLTLFRDNHAPTPTIAMLNKMMDVLVHHKLHRSIFGSKYDAMAATMPF
jgi:hypothetical protein